MSDIAVTWAKAQDCPTAKSKQVLACLASYADAEGEGWALIDVLAMEAQCTDRTVQRSLSALAGAELIALTGRKHLHMGKLVPIWKLNLDHGFASTRARRMAEMEARSGDASVTPGEGGEAGLGVTPVSPQDVTDVTPRGDASVTQIGKRITQGLKPFAGACAKAIKIWSEKAPERVSPPRVEAAWTRATDRTAIADGDLLAAVTAAVRRDPDFARGKAMNLDRWLDEGRFMAWLGDDAGKADQAVRVVAWEGPVEVRQAVLAVMGPGGVVSYLDPAGWDEARRVVIAHTGYALAQMRDRAGKALGDLGVSLERAHG